MSCFVCESYDVWNEPGYGCASCAVQCEVSLTDAKTPTKADVNIDTSEETMKSAK